jgi:Ser-tRNA(Ala) deacylase AlaX
MPSVTGAVKTRLRYLEDMHLYQDVARIYSISMEGDNRAYVLTDQTIFYPQGGGQPCDLGSIQTQSGRHDVLEVRMVDGEVRHLGIISGELHPGQVVTMEIDETRRKLNSRLHTAGELVCGAVRRIGHGDWFVVGAMHYPDRAEIHYDVTLDEASRRELVREVEGEVNRMIGNGGSVRSWWERDRSVVRRICGFEPNYLPSDQPIRLVVTYGDLGRPCVGTHVQNLAEVGTVRIVKVKCEKRRTTIRYELTEGL